MRRKAKLRMLDRKVKEEKEHRVRGIRREAKLRMLVEKKFKE